MKVVYNQKPIYKYYRLDVDSPYHKHVQLKWLAFRYSVRRKKTENYYIFDRLKTG